MPALAPAGVYLAAFMAVPALTLGAVLPLRGQVLASFLSQQAASFLSQHPADGLSQQAAAFLSQQSDLVEAQEAKARALTRESKRCFMLGCGFGLLLLRGVGAPVATSDNVAEWGNFTMMSSAGLRRDGKDQGRLLLSVSCLVASRCRPVPDQHCRSHHHPKCVARLRHRHALHPASISRRKIRSPQIGSDPIIREIYLNYDASHFIPSIRLLPFPCCR